MFAFLRRPQSCLGIPWTKAKKQKDQHVRCNIGLNDDSLHTEVEPRIPHSADMSPAALCTAMWTMIRSHSRDTVAELFLLEHVPSTNDY